MQLDIRIIAATNRNLVEAVNNKEFRADLFYRLNRGFIQLPPLKNRGDDIILLAKHFLRISNITYKKEIIGFEDNILELLKNYDFPGNVRELENIIFNAVAKTKENDSIKELDIPRLSSFQKKEAVQLITIDAAMEEHIKSVLNFTEGNTLRAADILGISERTLQRRLKSIREKE